MEHTSIGSVLRPLPQMSKRNEHIHTKVNNNGLAMQQALISSLPAQILERVQVGSPKQPGKSIPEKLCIDLASNCVSSFKINAKTGLTAMDERHSRVSSQKKKYHAVS